MGKDDYFNSEKGVTLIEMLVAAAIFVILVSAVSGLFISGIRIQRRILATQDLINQASYLMEYMSRSLRMARKELNCTNPNDPSTCSLSNPPFCLTISGYGYNYEISASGDKIKFIDYNAICTTFQLGGGAIWKDAGAGNVFELTSSKIQVNNFKVSLSGASQSDNLQPKVTIYLNVSSTAVADRPSVKIQTSISQRNVDFNY